MAKPSGLERRLRPTPPGRVATVTTQGRLNPAEASGSQWIGCHAEPVKPAGMNNVRDRRSSQAPAPAFLAKAVKRIRRPRGNLEMQQTARAAGHAGR